MSQMSELDAQIKELRACGENIISIADAIAKMFSSENEPVEAPKEEAMSFEEVRHHITLIAQAGFRKEVKALITKYGANKLSEIAPEKYPDLIKEADAIGKAGESDG